jgi:hypothetical protein
MIEKLSKELQEFKDGSNVVDKDKDKDKKEGKKGENE